jgi:hypothetical protein
MKLEYITINGLDKATQERMSKDIEASAYKGTKSAYIVQLCNEALAAREAKRGLADPAEFKELTALLRQIQETAADTQAEQGRQGIESAINQDLLIETFRLLVRVAASIGIKTTDIEEGHFDTLPEALGKKRQEAYKAYGNP